MEDTKVVLIQVTYIQSGGAVVPEKLNESNQKIVDMFENGMFPSADDVKVVKIKDFIRDEDK